MQLADELIDNIDNHVTEENFVETNIELGNFQHMEIFDSARFESILAVHNGSLADCIKYLRETGSGARFKVLKGCTGQNPVYSSRYNALHGCRILYTSYDNILLMIDVVTDHDKLSNNLYVRDPARVRQLIETHKNNQKVRACDTPPPDAPTQYKKSIKWSGSTVIMTDEQEHAVNTLHEHDTGILAGVAGAGKTLTIIELIMRKAQAALEQQSTHGVYYIGPGAIVNQINREYGKQLDNEYFTVKWTTMVNLIQELNPELAARTAICTARDTIAWIKTQFTNISKRKRKKNSDTTPYDNVYQESPEKIYHELLNMSFIDPEPQNISKYHSLGANQSLYAGADKLGQRNDIFTLYCNCLEWMHTNNLFNYELCNPLLTASPAAWHEREISLYPDEVQLLTPRNIKTLVLISQKNPNKTPRITWITDATQGIRSRIDNTPFLTKLLETMRNYGTIPTVLLNNNLRCPTEVITMLKHLRTIAEVNCGAVAYTLQGNIHQAIDVTHPGEVVWQHNTSDETFDMIRRYARDPDTISMTWPDDMGAMRQLLNIDDNSGIALDIRGENAGIQAKTIICFDLFNRPEFDTCRIPAAHEVVTPRILMRNELDEQDIIVFFNAVYVALSRTVERLILVNTTRHSTRLEQALQEIMPGVTLTPLYIDSKVTETKAIENAQRMLDAESITIDDAVSYLQHHVDAATLTTFTEINTVITADMILTKIISRDTSATTIEHILDKLMESIPLHNEVIELLEKKNGAQIVKFFTDLLKNPRFFIHAINDSNAHKFLMRVITVLTSNISAIIKERTRIVKLLGQFLSTQIDEGRFAGTYMLYALACHEFGSHLLHKLVESRCNQLENAILDTPLWYTAGSDPRELPFLVLPRSISGALLFEHLIKNERIQQAISTLPGRTFLQAAPIRPNPDIRQTILYNSPFTMLSSNYPLDTKEEKRKWHRLISTLLDLIASEDFFECFYYMPENDSTSEKFSAFEKMLRSVVVLMEFGRILDVKNGTLLTRNHEIMQKYNFATNWGLLFDDYGPLKPECLLAFMSSHSALILCTAIISGEIIKPVTRTNNKIFSVFHWIGKIQENASVIDPNTSPFYMLLAQVDYKKQRTSDLQDAYLIFHSALHYIVNYYFTLTQHNQDDAHYMKYAAQEAEWFAMLLNAHCLLMANEQNYRYLNLITNQALIRNIDRYQLTLFNDLPIQIWLDYYSEESRNAVAAIMHFYRKKEILLPTLLRIIHPVMKLCLECFAEDCSMALTVPERKVTGAALQATLSRSATSISSFNVIYDMLRDPGGYPSEYNLDDVILSTNFVRCVFRCLQNEQPVANLAEKILNIIDKRHPELIDGAVTEIMSYPHFKQNIKDLTCQQYEKLITMRENISSTNKLNIA